MRLRTVSISLCLALLVVVRPVPASACKVTNRPMAMLVASDQGVAGLQPWIATWHLAAAPVLTEVAAPCVRQTVCKGTSVAIERGTGYLRPAAALLPGHRYQLSSKQQLLLDFTTTDVDVVPALAAWDGLTITSAAVERATNTCGFEALVIRATVKNWAKHGPALSRHAVLLYAKRPDATAPARGLGRIVTLGAADLELVTNSVGGNWIKKKPPALWAILADHHGNLSAPIQLATP